MEEMNAYRIIHFVPEPICGMRLPIGALVKEDSEISFVRSNRSWHGNCFRDQESKRALKIILKKLEKMEIEDMESLPQSLGPAAKLDQRMVLPPTIKNVKNWVSKIL